MALNVVSNLGASIAHRAIKANEASVTQSVTRLSAGSRVVAARDDAASLAIGSRLRAETSALGQAVVNAGQAASLLQIAEGAAATLEGILVRMKTLAVQAGSGQLSNAERAVLDTEFQALIVEIDRIASDTEFNGVKLIGNAGVTFALRSDTTNGIVTLNGRTLGLGDTFTLADLEAGAVVYQHDGVSATTDRLIVSVSDAAGDDLGAVVGEGSTATFEDAEYFRSYGLSAINASTAYARGGTGSGITVAVIDTGVDVDHTDLDDNLIDHNVVLGLDVGDDDNNPNDDSLAADHGTHVAGIIGAEDNGTGTQGVAFQADLLAVKVAKSDGTFTDQEVADAIVKAVAEGADVINLSLAVSISSALAAALQLAIASDVVIIAAAGNFRGNPDPTLAALAEQPLPPAILAGTAFANGQILAVGAVDAADDVASFSHFAGDTDDFFVVAPGVNIESTTNDGATGFKSGTSMAAPHVAGAAAVLRQMFPLLDAQEIVSLIATSAFDLGDIGADNVFGRGQVDLARASLPQITINLNVASGATETLLATAADAESVYTSPFANVFSQFEFKIGTGVQQHDQVRLRTSSLTSKALGLEDAAISTALLADTASTTVSAAIDRLALARAEIGAGQNRLGYARANLLTATENSEAARSNLLDLDIAREVTQFTARTVLVQAGISVLAQANQRARELLKLLS
jgi:flagellin-like hook-associated protein FlgL